MRIIVASLLALWIAMVLLSGCISDSTLETKGSPAASMHSSQNVPVVLFDLAGDAGEYVGIFLKPNCETTAITGLWDLELASGVGAGEFWIIEPSTLVDDLNQLPNMKFEFGTFEPGTHIKNYTFFEAGNQNRIGVVAIIGAEVGWRAELSFELTQLECGYSVHQWNGKNGTVEQHQPEATLGSWNIPIQSPGWTHVVFPNAPPTNLGPTLFSIEFPNGFAWSDANIRTAAGTSGPSAGYAGTIQNEPGEIEATWTSSDTELDPTIFVIHMPGETIVPFEPTQGYCNSPLECTERF